MGAQEHKEVGKGETDLETTRGIGPDCSYYSEQHRGRFLPELQIRAKRSCSQPYPLVGAHLHGMFSKSFMKFGFGIS